MGQNNPPEERIAVGQLFAGRYQVIENIGNGAMATVYRCIDTREQNREVALKLLSQTFSKDSTTLARFRNEVSFCQRLEHPNVVKVFDFGQTEDNLYYITMEFLPGNSVGEQLDETPDFFEFDEILRILHDTASGLCFAHAEGIIHRDLKPDNILLTAERRAKVTDFGLARSLEADMQLTKSGEAVGTPCYMAPEQFRGERVDARTDVYALGIVAYELAAGDRPFLGDTYHAVATAHLLNPIPEIPAGSRSVPAWFQEFVQLCAQKDPNDRFQSMEEVIHELNYRMNLTDSLSGIRLSAANIIKHGLKIMGWRGTAPRRQ